MQVHRIPLPFSLVLASSVCSGLFCCEAWNHSTLDFQTQRQNLDKCSVAAGLSAPDRSGLVGEECEVLLMLQKNLDIDEEEQLADNATSSSGSAAFTEVARSSTSTHPMEEQVISDEPCSSTFCEDSHNAIFSMACGYSKADITPFVETLRQTGYTGALIIGINPDADDHTRKFLLENNATLKTEPCWEQEKMSLLTYADAHPEQVDNTQLQKRHYMGNLNQRRWRHYLEWLNKGNYSKVWLVDSRDVIFQTHPFQYLHAGLAFFAQYTKVEEWFYEKVKYCGPGQKKADDMRRSKMLNMCGGTIGGDARRIADLCEVMVSQIKDLHYDWPDYHNCGQNDQWLLNYHLLKNGMTRAGHYKEGNLFNFFDGPALNFFDKAVRENWWRHTNDNGTLVNKDGEPIAILHGWQDAANFSIDLFGVHYVGKKERKDSTLNAFGDVVRDILLFLLILFLVGTATYCFW